MKITVRLFAAARQLTGRESVQVEMAGGADVAALREALVAQAPDLKGLVRHAMIAVNTEYVRDDAPLDEADEVALIPPVSGG